MQGSVHTHQPVAPCPVDMGCHTRTSTRQVLSFRGNMDNGLLVLFIDGSGNLEFRAVFQFQGAAVAGLATASGIKHRSVQYDTASLVHTDHLSFTGSEVGVVAKQWCGHLELPVLKSVELNNDQPSAQGLFDVHQGLKNQRPQSCRTAGVILD